MSNTIHDNPDTTIDDVHLATIEDARRQALALIRARQGHSELRHQMLQIYGGRCAVTGTDVIETLDVALIVPSTSEQAHHPRNALLLRTDLHTLFVKHLIAVDSATMSIVLSPLLCHSSYAELAGRSLRRPVHASDCPDRQALDLHRSWLQTEAIVQPYRPKAVDYSPVKLSTLPSLRSHDPSFLGAPAGLASRITLLPLSGMTLNNKSCVNSICFHPRGDDIAVACWDGLIRIWRINDAFLVNTLNGEIGEVNSVCFSPDGQYIASGGRNPNVQIWHYADGKLIHSLAGHEGAVFSVAYSPHSRLLASGSWDRTVRIWDSDDGSSVQILNDHRGAVNSVAFSPAGTSVASASHDRNVRIWDARDGRLMHLLQGHSDAVFSIAYSPDGRVLASAGCDRAIHLWDTVTGACIRVLEGHSGAIFTLAYSPNGKTLISGDYDRNLRLWRAGDGILLHEGHQHFEGITTLNYAPDASHIISGSFDATVRFWRLSAE